METVVEISNFQNSFVNQFRQSDCVSLLILWYSVGLYDESWPTCSSWTKFDFYQYMLSKADLLKVVLQIYLEICFKIEWREIILCQKTTISRLFVYIQQLSLCHIRKTQQPSWISYLVLSCPQRKSELQNICQCCWYTMDLCNYQVFMKE